MTPVRATTAVLLLAALAGAGEEGARLSRTVRPVGCNHDQERTAAERHEGLAAERVALHHLELERVALGQHWRGHERRVDGNGRDHGLAGLAGAADGGVDARDERAHESDPLGLDFPAMTATDVVDDGSEDGVALSGVSVHAMRGAGLDGFDDGGRRLEVHVRDPTRDDVLIGILVPLGAVGPGAFRTAVKIESHSLR